VVKLDPRCSVHTYHHVVCWFDTGVDGGWTSWSSWSACSSSCSGGTQWRQRTCSSPPPSGSGRDCAGRGHDARPCNASGGGGGHGLAECFGPGHWSCWSELGPCSVSCGPGGSRRRVRRCQPPQQRAPAGAVPASSGCHGNDTETLPCDGPLVPCPSPGISCHHHHHHHSDKINVVYVQKHCKTTLQYMGLKHTNN